MTDELAPRRVEKQSDNMEVRPIDVVRKLLHDIESGKVTPDKVFILIVENKDDGSWDRYTYRAGLTFEQEIALLELAKKRSVERWVGD